MSVALVDIDSVDLMSDGLHYSADRMIEIGRGFRQALWSKTYGHHFEDVRHEAGELVDAERWLIVADGFHLSPLPRTQFRWVERDGKMVSGGGVLIGQPCCCSPGRGGCRPIGGGTSS